MTILPRDTGPYFDFTETSVSCNNNVVQACKADPERVCLVIGVSTNAAGVGITSKSGTAIGGGMFITPQSPFVLYDFANGPMVQREWFITSTLAITVAVFEMFLRRMPQSGELPGRR